MTDSPVTSSRDGDVAVIHIDDGKANALSFQAIDELNAALDAAADAGAVVLVGRPGRFSAGFDLSVMQAGIADVRRLVTAGAELCLRLYEHPRPVVAACTGHALAAGAIMLMSCDVRIGAAGEFKIGMNEVSIGMPVPVFAVELARDRLSRRHFTPATALSRIYDPEGACDAGFLDQTVDPDEVESAAIAEAARLAAGLKRAGFMATRRNTRGAIADHIRSTLHEDLATFDVET